jgi:hypothetical protein
MTEGTESDECRLSSPPSAPERRMRPSPAWLEYGPAIDSARRRSGLRLVEVVLRDAESSLYCGARVSGIRRVDRETEREAFCAR